MVKVVVTLTERNQGNQPIVLGRRIDVVGRFAEQVTDRIDEEGRVVDQSQPKTNGNDKSAQQMAGQCTQHERRDDAGNNGPQVVVAVLICQQRIFFQILDVGVVHIVLPAGQPADMRIKESFLYAVGVPVRIDVSMVLAVLRTPRRTAGEIVPVCSF